MSQQKVDKYKKAKANRNEIIKKEKRALRLEIIAATALMVILLGWFGYSYYNRVEETKPPTEYTIDSSAVDEYLSELEAPADEVGDEETEDVMLEN